jgi:hypothetical protein
MYSLIVSDLPISRLLEAFHRKTAIPFVRVPSDQRSIDRSAGHPLIAGETGGRSYLVDLSAAILATMWSKLEDIASDYDCLIVSTSHDRIEGQCELFAALGSNVLRMFWSNAKRTTKEYSIGDLLASEAISPLSNPDGSGLTGALRSFNFHQMDYAIGFKRVPGDFVVLWAGDPFELLKCDDTHQQINNHVRKCSNANYQPPVASVRVNRQMNSE